MLEPRLTTCPISLHTQLRLVSGSTLATFELKAAEKIQLDAVDSEEHDGVDSLASECRDAWRAWRDDLVEWLGQEATEMAMVQSLMKMGVLGTIANVVVGDGLDGG